MWLAFDYVDFRNDTAVANGWMQRAHRLPRPQWPVQDGTGAITDDYGIIVELKK